MKLLRVFVYSLLFLPFIVLAEQQVKITYENIDSFPWNMKDGSGIDLILLKMVDDAMPEVSFKYNQAPWKRCLNNIETDKTQACFSASYKEKRLQHGFYPGTQTGGEVDPALRLHSSSYSLYVTKGSNINVTGKMAIEGLNGKIAAPSGYSIGDDLAKAGYNVDAGGTNTINNFKKLVSGRVAAVAALTLNGDNIILKNLAYAEQIKTIKTPLVDKPYYLMFSKQFVKSNQALADNIWKKIAELRETQEYKDKAGAFLAQ